MPALRVGMQARLGVWVRRDLDGRGFTRLVAVVIPQGPVKDPLLVGPHRLVLEVTDGDHHVPRDGIFAADDTAAWAELDLEASGTWHDDAVPARVDDRPHGPLRAQAPQTWDVVTVAR